MNPEIKNDNFYSVIPDDKRRELFKIIDDNTQQMQNKTAKVGGKYLFIVFLIIATLMLIIYFSPMDISTKSYLILIGVFPLTVVGALIAIKKASDKVSKDWNWNEFDKKIKELKLDEYFLNTEENGKTE